MARKSDVVEKERLITAEELARMKLRYPCELVEGKIVRMSPTGKRHGAVVGNVNELLVTFVARKKLGKITSAEAGFLVRRNPETVRAPDLAFVSHELLALSRASAGTYFPRAPELAVEVLSPDNTWKEIEKKVTDYLEAGSKLVWVVSPDSESVYVYGPSGSGRVLRSSERIDGGDALPGFKAKVAAFFAES